MSLERSKLKQGLREKLQGSRKSERDLRLVLYGHELSLNNSLFQNLQLLMLDLDQLIIRGLLFSRCDLDQQDFQLHPQLLAFDQDIRDLLLAELQLLERGFEAQLLAFDLPQAREIEQKKIFNSPKKVGSRQLSLSAGFLLIKVLGFRCGCSIQGDH